MSEIINVKELRVGKGKTIQDGEAWHKTYYELVLNTEGFSPELVELHRETAEGYLNKLLAMPESNTPEPPLEFNPEELISHRWKGKTNPKGGYYPGNLDFGWDFADKFSQEVIRCLPLTINGYAFSLSESKKIINVKKANG